MDKRMIYSINLQKLMKAGLTVKCMDGQYKDIKRASEKQIKRIPFSNYHNTYAEFLKDLEKIYDMHLAFIDIPETLINKVKATMIELDIEG